LLQLAVGEYRDWDEFYLVLDSAALRDVIHHFVVTERRRTEKRMKTRVKVT
jgi:hypothetical protein